MKNILLSALLVIIALHAPAQSQFSIQEAIDYALANSVEVKNAALDREATDNQAKAEHGRLMPQIDADVDYVHNFNVQKIILENGVIPAFTSPEIPYGTVEAFQLQLNNVLTGSITLNQVIFDASLFAGLKSEENVKDLATQQLTRTRIDVAEQVSKAYYGVLVAQKQYDFLAKNLARMDTLYRETQARVKSGVARQIDLDRIEVQFNNLKEEQKKAQQLTDLSYALLRFHMNVPQSEQLVLSDSLNESSLAASLAAATGYDYTQRIEYTMLSTQKKIELSDMQMKRASNIPKLRAFATTGYNPAATHFGDLFQSERFYNYTYAGLKLSVPLFHGFARKHDLAGSHIRLEKLENSLAQVQRRIDLQVEQSRINLFNNLESLKTQKRNLELAEENVRVIRIENQQGIATNVEVTNAEADLKQAQTHYYNTLYQALISKIDLEKATGTLISDKL